LADAATSPAALEAAAEATTGDVAAETEDTALENACDTAADGRRSVFERQAQATRSALSATKPIESIA
jgi:hypothetical protein